ncbi:alpha/beta fold hydrolase [Rathayibacter sp. YIM 133350]|uniref:alpha/beta fold hydrolase n=1 Tax=Rathayibacter sp. YIM 133350 TaxID=3131992 RepID=UPI00307F3389
MVIAASLPSSGLPGLDAGYSRIVSAAGAEWHLLDNGPALEAAGVTPVGTLLCVHGNPTWSYLWRQLVTQATDAALADGSDSGWRVIAVDQLEMGYSERTGRVRRLADRVADLGALTEALGLEGKLITVGHDWGGPVSLGWAVDHPDLLAGVVLLNTAVHQPEGRPIPAPLRLALAPGVLDVGTAATPSFLETTLSLARPALERGVRDAFHSPYTSSRRRRGIRDFVADIPADPSHPSFPELDRIAAGVAALDVPALVLWGPRDPVFGEVYLRDLIDRLPHADVHRFEGAGHLIAEEVDYASVVLDWLDETVRPPRADSASEAASEDEREPSEPLWAPIQRNAGLDAPALIDMGAGPDGSERVVTWSLLARRVEQLAHGLVAAGVRFGDRISLLVPPSADLTAVLYAAVRIGAVVVVADAGLGLRGLGRAIRGAHPTVIVGALPGLLAARALGWPGRRISVATLSPAFARSLSVEHSLGDLLRLGRARMATGTDRAPLPTPSGADLAAVLFTSGSTGPAKGVRYTQAQLGALRDALATHFELGEGTGLVAGFAPFALLGPALGARSVIPVGDVTAPRTLTATAVADAARAADATVLFLSPAALANVVATADRLDDAQRDALARIRTVLSAGAPVSARLLERIVALMPAATAHTPYGMTEGLLMTDITLDGIHAASGAGEARPTDGEADAGGVCVGAPVAGVVVRISPLDSEGRPTPRLTAEPGVTGEIVVAAPHLREGYDRLWAVDRIARAHSDGAVRRHSTGDVGHLDAEGRLWIEGRLQHVMVTADGVVTPVGIEQRIEGVDGVRRAAVVGVGPRGTQALVAVVELDRRAGAGLADASLAAAVRAASSRPLAAVLTVGVLPTDIRHNSKIDRTALAAWADSVLRGKRVRRP